ncbi:MAG: hypothetical protein ACAF41_05445 [Leptolyngbya sp. BL-A-14]
MGVSIGARDEAAVCKLWQSVPVVYRQCAIAYSDFWAAYAAVLLSKRHRTVGKETGKISYIERFNNTLRQRVSRLMTMHHYLCGTTRFCTLLSAQHLA